MNPSSPPDCFLILLTPAPPADRCLVDDPLSANVDIRLPGKGWRNRIGEEGVEWLLTETIKAGQRAGTVQDDHLKKVTVDTTVMES